MPKTRINYEIDIKNNANEKKHDMLRLVLACRVFIGKLISNIR